MASREKVVFLFDVDNTLLDNDRVEADLRHHLEKEFGPRAGDRYFSIFEELRSELGYADYLGACSGTVLKKCAIRGCCGCLHSSWTTRSPTGCSRVSRCH